MIFSRARPKLGGPAREEPQLFDPLRRWHPRVQFAIRPEPPSGTAASSDHQRARCRPSGFSINPSCVRSGMLWRCLFIPHETTVPVQETEYCTAAVLRHVFKSRRWRAHREYSRDKKSAQIPGNFGPASDLFTMIAAVIILGLLTLLVATDADPHEPTLSTETSSTEEKSARGPLMLPLRRHFSSWLRTKFTRSAAKKTTFLPSHE